MPGRTVRPGAAWPSAPVPDDVPGASGEDVGRDAAEAGGAGDEHTRRAHCAAFQRWGLYPRMLVAPTERDMSIELFGVRCPRPCS
ncbi:alpha-hydroxy-acid oxidizing protein [Streptomyces hygroscopicus]|uniref:alpha-hydroxy-acid oxidizing protein n=1 Tax=Streptomyces hygroscopicus TaxID=1912 RepID=UPI00202FE012|nr:alpha-hydroxy-acid oxidizing protein [Streptomyces hygroscopicus]